MTILKERGHITVQCNSCGQFRRDQDGGRPKFKTYKQVWAEAQAEGWSAARKPGAKDWNHHCPGCKQNA